MSHVGLKMNFTLNTMMEMGSQGAIVSSTRIIFFNLLQVRHLFDRSCIYLHICYSLSYSALIWINVIVFYKTFRMPSFLRSKFFSFFFKLHHKQFQQYNVGLIKFRIYCIYPGSCIIYNVYFSILLHFSPRLDFYTVFSNDIQYYQNSSQPLAL